MTARTQNPFPAAEGETIYDITATWCGYKCATSVIGLARLHWTMQQWANTNHDCIKFTERGKPKVKQSKSIKSAVNRPRSFI